MCTEVLQSSHQISFSADGYLMLNTKLSFPIKVHEMLEEMDTAGDQSIVSWQPHGKAFRVHQPDAFARIVMPRYFKQQTKYKSFQRQLLMYGFHRIGKGIDRGAYFHSMFIRNKKSMSLHMSCKKQIKGKKTSTSKAVDYHAAGDPDFYSSESNLDSNLLTDALQSDPILQASASSSTNEKKRVWPKEPGPARTGFTNEEGSSDPHMDEEMSLRNSALLLHQEVSEGVPSPSNQLVAGWNGHKPFCRASRNRAHLIMSLIVQHLKKATMLQYFRIG